MISVFSRVLRILTQFCLYAGNMDQRKSVFWHISRSVHQKKKKKEEEEEKARNSSNNSNFDELYSP